MFARICCALRCVAPTYLIDMLIVIHAYGFSWHCVNKPSLIAGAGEITRCCWRPTYRIRFVPLPPPRRCPTTFPNTIKLGPSPAATPPIKSTKVINGSLLVVVRRLRAQTHLKVIVLSLLMERDYDRARRERISAHTRIPQPAKQQETVYAKHRKIAFHARMPERNMDAGPAH